MEKIKIDLCFPVQGREIPLDHGYALFAALSGLLDTDAKSPVHENPNLGVHPIRGRYQGPGRLAVGPMSHVTLRLPAAQIGDVLALSGKPLSLSGHLVRLGVPTPRALIPAPKLYAHRVTTKNGQDEARFDEEIARQLTALDIEAKAQRGPRRSFRMKDKVVIAHTVVVAGLTAEESIRLQEEGLGGRRKLGCGVFVPKEET